MLVEKTQKIKVNSIEYNDEIITFNTNYKQTFTSYSFRDEDLVVYKDLIDQFHTDEFNLFLWIEPEGFRLNPVQMVINGVVKTVPERINSLANLVKMTTEPRDPMEIFKPMALKDIEEVSLKYIPFFYGKEIFLQRDGFHLLVGPTGSGKTHMAIQNLPMLEKNYDIVLYLSLEVTPLDIKTRYWKTNFKIPGDNLIIGQTISVKQISDYIGDKSACIIVDNVDNLVRAGVGAFDTQMTFVMEFDEWAKRTGNTGIFLTQITKDFKDNLLVTDKKTGGVSINPDITFNSVAGVKQLATMSRSVLLTYYDFNYMMGFNKILKKGSALFETELNDDERRTFIK